MPFWWQQLREEISLAQVIPDWDSRPPPPPPRHNRPPLDPASDATSQDTEQRHAPTRSPLQKHARPVASGDTGRWTVPRDALTPLERSPPPRPGEWNVHRDALVPLGRSPLLTKTPAQHYKSLSNDRTQVPGPQPMSRT